MLLTNTYMIAPAQCRLCRVANLPAVDTLIDEFDQVGAARIYICHRCITNMANMVGPKAPDPFRLYAVAEVDDLIDTLARTEAEFEHAKGRLAQFEQIAAFMRDATEELIAAEKEPDDAPAN